MANKYILKMIFMFSRSQGNGNEDNRERYYQIGKTKPQMIMFNLGKDEENWHSYISAGRNVNC